MGRRVLRADDALLTWSGAVEVEHTSEWSRAWRLPLSRIGLFPSDGLHTMAAMQAGVRVTFTTDTISLGGLAFSVDAGDEPLVLDLVVDDELIASAPVAADGRFAFGGLPPGEKNVELWLPQRGDFRLAELHLNATAWIQPTSVVQRPRLITYGSSITHCRSVPSPTRAWPAIVARRLGLDLTCLGFAGQCHLDPMIGRLIRDLPADVIVTCLGINVYGAGTFSERSFLPAVLGLLTTIRDGHPDTPLIVISPIHSPEREQTAGASGLTLAQLRAQVSDAVRLLVAHGDQGIRLLDGFDVIGPGHADLLHDGLHPSPGGYAHMATAIEPVVRQALASLSAATRPGSPTAGA